MSFQQLPQLPVLPDGWHIFGDNTVLGALGATFRLLGAPDSRYRLCGPKWVVVIAWAVPEDVALGVVLYADQCEVIAEVDGAGFWDALENGVRDWCAEMPAALRARILSDVKPLAMAERIAMAYARAKKAPAR